MLTIISGSKEYLEIIPNACKLNGIKIGAYQEIINKKVPINHMVSKEISKKLTSNEVYLENCFKQNQYLFNNIIKSPIIECGDKYTLEEGLGLLDNSFPIDYNADYIPLIHLNFLNISLNFF
jgi:hypothetical protein